MDGDIVVEDGWLEDLRELVEIPNVAVSSYFFSGNGTIEQIKGFGLKAEMMEIGDKKFIKTDIINGGIWMIRKKILDKLGGYVVGEKWGGALDSGFSSKIDRIGMMKIYGVNRKAVHLGGSISTKNNRDKDIVCSAKFYNDFLKYNFLDIYKEYNSEA